MDEMRGCPICYRVRGHMPTCTNNEVCPALPDAPKACCELSEETGHHEPDCPQNPDIPNAANWLADVRREAPRPESNSLADLRRALREGDAAYEAEHGVELPPGSATVLPRRVQHSVEVSLRMRPSGLRRALLRDGVVEEIIGKGISDAISRYLDECGTLGEYKVSVELSLSKRGTGGVTFVRRPHK